MDSDAAYKIFGVVAYLAILLGIGIAASRRMKDMRDYFAAGKDLGYLAVAFSSRATGESAWLLLGLTGMGAAMGVKAFWVVAGELLGVAGAWYLMSRRFKRLTDRYDSITVPDYLESRFRDSGHSLRLVAAFALMIFVTIYVSAQIDATGKAFESFLGLNYYAGAFGGFVVVLIYITSGGFVAVAWSDVFQGALMFLGLTLLPLVALGGVGGLGPLFDQLAALDPTLLSPMGAGGMSPVSIAGVLGLLLIGLGFLGSPQIFVRFIALRSEDEIRMGARVAIVWTLLAEVGAVFIGMIGRVVFTPAGQDVTATLGPSAENVLPMLVEHTMPALLVGLYIAIVLSAIMSTIDSLLVVAGSALVRDYYQKVKRPDLSDASLVSISRWATVGLALVGLGIAMAVAISTPDRTIFWFVIFGWSGIAATFCPTIILSLFWPKMTGRGALAAMVSGFAGVPIFKFLAPDLPGIGPIFGAIGELAPAFLFSLAMGVALSISDTEGQRRLTGIERELEEAGRPEVL